MKKILSLLLSTMLWALPVAAQSAQLPASSSPQEDEELVRITSELVQTDAVVTDKNDQMVTDLKLEDFEVYDNGKRQDLKFIEFISTDTGRRVEGQRALADATRAAKASTVKVPTDLAHDISAAELKRVFAFVVDDLTIPFEDMTTVRRVLGDFVDNQMKDGDLVAIVRTIGGKGLLQQFTSDKQLLRQAISALNVTTNAYSAFNNPPQPRLVGGDLTPLGVGGAEQALNEQFATAASVNTQILAGVDRETAHQLRALMSLSTANYIVDGLKQLPGRKNLVLFSGGLPIYQVDTTGNFSSNISYLIRQLTDNAARAGVAISTMDVQGLKVGSAAPKFTDTPARSGIALNQPSGFGRQPDPAFDSGGAFGQFEGQTGLRSLANETGGVSILNTNDFKTGLDQIVSHSSSYYILAYTPSEKFDSKFHKVQIKVKRPGLKVSTRAGYIAREEQTKPGARTKEQVIAIAARSPLARRDIDLSANVALKPLAANKTEIGIHLLIDAKKLHFTPAADGKYQTSFDIAGFIVDELGKTRGGFSETVNANLSQESYQHALASGLTYSATTELPSGYFQLRAVVREASTGALGTLTRYLETPDISKGRLTMSSVFLYAVGLQGGSNAQAEPLLALRQLTRQQDLRYAAIIYNPKLSNGKPQLRSQVIISQGSKILFQEPEQEVAPPANGASPVVKIGQLGISKIRAGRYILTLIITDTLADKKNQTISSSIDFMVVD